MMWCASGPSRSGSVRAHSSACVSRRKLTPCLPKQQAHRQATARRTHRGLHTARTQAPDPAVLRLGQAEQQAGRLGRLRLPLRALLRRVRRRGAFWHTALLLVSCKKSTLANQAWSTFSSSSMPHVGQHPTDKNLLCNCGSFFQSIFGNSILRPVPIKLSLVSSVVSLVASLRSAPVAVPLADIADEHANNAPERLASNWLVR